MDGSAAWSSLPVYSVFIRLLLNYYCVLMTVCCVLLKERQISRCGADVDACSGREDTTADRTGSSELIKTYTLSSLSV